jgi:hypothetical protein
MKANFFQLITGAAIVGTIGSGIFTPAQAVQVWNLNFVPEATGATGTGTGTLTYNELARALTIAVSFSGLSGTTTVAHIHAPTAVAGTGNAGVATTTPSFVGFPTGVKADSYNTTLDLTLASSYNGAFITNNGGTTETAQAALISSFDARKAYFNIHTTTFGRGEIRATVTPVPWETDALSVVGTTLLFGFGVWKKNKLSQRNLK